MFNSKPISTLLVFGNSLTAIDGLTPVNAAMYRKVFGGLQHLQMTHPDISFSVNKLSQFMHEPSKHHWGKVKSLLRYLNGMRSLSIRLVADTPLTLCSFSNGYWVSNPNDRTSTMAFLIFLGANPISWSSVKQHPVVHSSIEVEYHAIVVVATDRATVG